MNNISYVIMACYPDKGMKSHGSKSLMTFNNNKLLDYQLSVIKQLHHKKDNYEIILVCDFDILKTQKYFSDKVKIIQSDKFNPVYTGASAAKYANVLFIDYGCIFDKEIIQQLTKDYYSKILCVKKYKHGKLDVGCIQTDESLHFFFDLPNNKFCNMFYLIETDLRAIITNKKYGIYNLLYFEILNMLNNNNQIKIAYADNMNFIYFNNMRQKNAINKFLSKI